MTKFILRIFQIIWNLLGERDKTLGAIRSSEWPKVRKKHLALHPFCAVCEGNKSIEVHHIKPFHSHRELELDPNNLITLCESGHNGVICHQFFGHLGNYRSINENITVDVMLWRDKLHNRP